MRLFKKRPELKDVSLQMTSMIDIVFLLVIFFMCTVQISKLELDPDVVLPVAYSGSPEGGSGRLVVNVGRGGELRVMAASYTLEALERLIAEEAARRPAPDGGTALAVRVRADADAPYRHVGEVMTACRKAGVWKLSFGASPGESPEGGRRL
jgi:biopolymer transport protein ExbD